MSEENQENLNQEKPIKSIEKISVTPVEAILVAPIKEVIVSPVGKKIPRKKQATKIDLLPENIRKDFDSLVLEGYGVKSVLNMLKVKFPTQLEILPDYQSVTKYLKTDIERLRTEKELGTEMATIVKDATADLHAISTAMVSPMLNLDNKKEVYETIFTRMNKRLTYLEQKCLTGNFFDRDMEAAMIAYGREMRQLTDSLAKAGAEINTNLRDEFAQELEAYSRVLLTIVVRCAKEVYGEDKFSQFYALVVDQLARSIRDFKTAKEQLNKGA